MVVLFFICVYQNLQHFINKLLSLKPGDRPSIEQIMAEPILANSIVNLFTDIGRLPCNKPRPQAVGGTGGKRRQILVGSKGNRQRSFFEDYWAEEDDVRKC